jgi:mercuric ion binding protein
MKTLNIYAALLFSIFAVNSSIAQNSMKHDTIRVWGNCGMCKKVIEKAAKTAGATKARWNDETKLLLVSYVENKTSNTRIQESIARSGYDTQDMTADNMAYNKLPGCCHYDRKGGVTEVQINVKTTYTCPMHPNVVSDKMGKCPDCGMNLVEKKIKQ